MHVSCKFQLEFEHKKNKLIYLQIIKGEYGNQLAVPF